MRPRSLTGLATAWIIICAVVGIAATLFMGWAIFSLVIWLTSQTL